MYDYGRWLSIQCAGSGAQEEEKISSGVKSGGYCRRCMRITDSYFEKRDGYTEYWCDICGRRKRG